MGTVGSAVKQDKTEENVWWYFRGDFARIVGICE